MITRCVPTANTCDVLTSIATCLYTNTERFSLCRSLLSGTAAAEPSTESSAVSDPAKAAGSDKASTGVPYRAFLRNGPTRALMFTHFCNNWFHYTMLAWLPTYFTQTLHLNIAEASTVSLFPSIAGVLVSSIAGTRSCSFANKFVFVWKHTMGMCIPFHCGALHCSHMCVVCLMYKLRL